MTHTWRINYEALPNVSRSLLIEHFGNCMNDNGFFSLDEENFDKAVEKMDLKKKVEYEKDLEALKILIDREGSVDIQVD